ncbi:FAD-dependent oxidoreductase, partial [Klebsiella aerogenes]|uniref:FAD-dependent oxidoreductase n=1 Tax=Klebsiella aerogenes TaxID=548 RepID=UPI0013D31723
TRTIRLAASRDAEGREITPERLIPYDTLVLAVGSTTNDFGTPGVQEHAIALDTQDQAVRFHQRLVNAMLRAHTQEGAQHRVD